MQRAALTKQLYGAPTQFAAANKKFAVGKNPLELESELDVIQPQNAQQQKRMVEVMEALYKDAKNDPAKRVALEMWRMQLQSADAESLVKTDFQKRFYFWLLGRGTKEDTDKTFWGRGNMAAHNPEVAAYIDQFLESRANYAMQLALLANRAPTSLLGAYLYFKYIVNGNLKQTTKGDKTWWHLDQSDYLEDFDLFRKYFDKVPDGNGGERAATRDDQYSKLVQPQQFRAEVDPNAPANAGQEPYPITSEQKQKWALKDDAGIKESIGMVETETEDPLWNSQWGVNPNKPPKKPRPGRPLPGGASEDPVPSAGAANLPANVATVDSAAIAAQVAASLAEERRQRAVAEAGERAAKTERKQRKQELKQQRHDAMMEALRRSNRPPAPGATAGVGAPPVRDESWLDEQRRNLEAFSTKSRGEMQTWMTKTLADQRVEMEAREKALVAELAKFGQAGRDDGKMARQLASLHTGTLDALRQLGADLRSYRRPEEIVRDVPSNKDDLEAIRQEASTRQAAAQRELDEKLTHTVKAFEARQQELVAALDAQRANTAAAGDQSVKIAQAANAEIAKLQAQLDEQEASLAAKVNAANEARERQHADEVAAYQAREKEMEGKLANAQRMLAEDTVKVRKEMQAKVDATAAKLRADAQAQTDAEKQRLQQEASQREIRDREARQAEHIAMQKYVNAALESGQREVGEAVAYVQRLTAENQRIRALLDNGSRSAATTSAETAKLRRALQQNEHNANRIASKIEQVERQPLPSVAGPSEKGKEEASEPVPPVMRKTTVSPPEMKQVTKMGEISFSAEEPAKSKKREAEPVEAPVEQQPAEMKKASTVRVESQPSRVVTRAQARARAVKPVPPKFAPMVVAQPPTMRRTTVPGPAMRVVTKMGDINFSPIAPVPRDVPVPNVAPRPVVHAVPAKKEAEPVAAATQEEVQEAAKAEQSAEAESKSAKKSAAKQAATTMAARKTKALNNLRGNPKRAMADAVGELRKEMAVETDMPKGEQVADDWEKLESTRATFEIAGADMPALDHSLSFEANYKRQLKAAKNAGRNIAERAARIHKRGKTRTPRAERIGQIVARTGTGLAQ